MKILVAEDDYATGIYMCAALKDLGHEAILARDGQEAWEVYQASGPDMVISDWMMPKIDGLELVRLIRAGARKRYTYVLLLTALGGKGSYLEGMRAGADDFVTKPHDLDTLAARLRVAERILGLTAHVANLEGLLPICSWCKKIRDEQEIWLPLETYIAGRTDARFTHGICPDCYDEVTLPMAEEIRRRLRHDTP